MGAFDQNAAAVLAQKTSAQPWLKAFRDSSRQQWLARPLPNRKTEDWKYTALAPLGQDDYLRFGSAGDTSVGEIPASNVRIRPARRRRTRASKARPVVYFRWEIWRTSSSRRSTTIIPMSTGRHSASSHPQDENPSFLHHATTSSGSCWGPPRMQGTQAT